MCNPDNCVLLDACEGNRYHPALTHTHSTVDVLFYMHIQQSELIVACPLCFRFPLSSTDYTENDSVSNVKHSVINIFLVIHFILLQMLITYDILSNRLSDTSAAQWQASVPVPKSEEKLSNQQTTKARLHPCILVFSIVCTVILSLGLS